MDAGIGGRFALCLLRGSVKTEGKKSRERGNEGKAKLLQLYPLEHSSTYIEDSELPYSTSSTPLNLANPFDRSRDFFLSLLLFTSSLSDNSVQPSRPKRLSIVY